MSVTGDRDCGDDDVSCALKFDDAGDVSLALRHRMTQVNRFMHKFGAFRRGPEARWVATRGSGEGERADSFHRQRDLQRHGDSCRAT